MEYTHIGNRQLVQVTNEMIAELEMEHFRLVLLDHAHGRPRELSPNQARLEEIETMVVRLRDTLIPRDALRAVEETTQAPVGEGDHPPDPGAASPTGPAPGPEEEGETQ